jgi:ribosomal protein L35AE/L33A
MTANPRRTFHYHANAHVLSGHFTRPIQHLIEVQGASSLPTIGGHGKGHVQDFRFEHFVSLKRGYTHVSGSPQETDGKTYFTTLVTAVAEGLNFLDVVTAGRVVARFASSYSFDDKEPHFTFVGSKFENLQIAGCETKVDLDVDLFEKIPTFEAATKEFKSNREFRKIAEDPFATGDKLPEQQPHGAILCSIVDVKNMQTTCPGVERKGHCFVIPKFGKLFLGEILLQHGRRTLTMMRFELGSPVSGTGTAVQLDSNGQPYPPNR